MSVTGSVAPDQRSGLAEARGTAKVRRFRRESGESAFAAAPLRRDRLRVLVTRVCGCRRRPRRSSP
jgi:hypothetical protein